MSETMWYLRIVFVLFFAGRSPTSLIASSWVLVILSVTLAGVSCSRENVTEGQGLTFQPRSVGRFGGSSVPFPSEWDRSGKNDLSSRLALNSRMVSTLSDCGRPSPMVALIVNGIVGFPATYPWHVAIYYFFEKKFNYWCGGSLISKFIVLTAAHCTWKVVPENLVVGLGKIYRDFDASENNVQKIKAKKVETLASYQDAEGNYNGDLSVIFLEKAAVFSDFVKAICIDWNQEFVDEHLTEGSLGVVPGWGLTENGTYGDTLRVLRLPVVSDKKCMAGQPMGFKKYITYTSFCAGYRNGSGVCNGDSGGGLAFHDVPSDRWYLQGLVSVSPRKEGTSNCDPFRYTVFTKVSMFTKWLQDLMTLEENFLEESEKPEKVNLQNKDIYEHIRKYFNWQMPLEETSNLVLPHTEKMLKFRKPEFFNLSSPMSGGGEG